MTTPVNPLEMSDEDFLNTNPADIPMVSSETVPEQEPNNPTDDSQEGNSEVSRGNSEVPEETEQSEQESVENNEQQDSNESQKVFSNEENKEPQKEPENVKENTSPGTSTKWEDLAKPFKANGKEITIDNPDDALKLMQMGANYTKKMQQLQPRLKIIKMLENNGLLDENKLSYLIEIDKKNPQAIEKLIKEANIDPLDIDTTRGDTYKPSNYSVSDSEMAFSYVLEDVLTTPSGRETVNLIQTEWDDESKDKLFREPEVLKYINDQRASGVYDIISSEIEKQKMLGNLPNTLSFLEAYTRVGSMLQQARQNNTPVAPVARRTPVTKTSNEDINNRARAASPTRVSSGSGSKKDINYLEISDEDFLNNFVNKF